MKISDFEVGIRYLVLRGNNHNIFNRDHIFIMEDGRLVVLESQGLIEKENVKYSIKDIKAIANYKLKDMPKTDFLEFFSDEHGWFATEELHYWMIENGFDIIEGKFHNHFDGEEHYIYTHTETGKRLDLKANWYDNNTFIPLIEWIEQFCKLTINKDYN
jgi:hypothetical protein